MTKFLSDKWLAERDIIQLDDDERLWLVSFQLKNKNALPSTFFCLSTSFAFLRLFSMFPTCFDDSYFLLVLLNFFCSVVKIDLSAISNFSYFRSTEVVFKMYLLFYFLFTFSLCFIFPSHFPYLFLCKKITSKIKFNRFFYLKNRWYDEKVSSLDLSAPLSIMPDLSVDQTIKIMNNEGFDQLPVIDELG